MLMPFGMTGSLRWASGEGDRRAHDRVVFRFRDGELRRGTVWCPRCQPE
jgi:formamidopyrimidine-DNA glycosylase